LDVWKRWIWIWSFEFFWIRSVFEKKQDCANKYFITNENSKLQHVLFKLDSSSPNALYILLLHASIHSWEDSSGIALNSFVTALLMVVESWKTVPFNTPLNMGKRKNSQGLNPVSRVVAPTWQCYFWPKIPGCSRPCEQEHCRDGTAMIHSQIFRNDPPTLSLFMPDIPLLSSEQ